MALDKITTLQIPDGEAGTRETLRLMGGLVKRGKTDPAIYAFARELIAPLEPKDWVGQIRVVYEFVRDHIRYVHDIDGMEGLQTPAVTLEIRAGDCDDKVTLLCALLTTIGHPCRMCAVKLDNDPDFSHVFAQTLMGSAWINMETTEGPLPLGELGPNGFRLVQPMLVYTVR